MKYFFFFFFTLNQINLLHFFFNKIKCFSVSSESFYQIITSKGLLLCNTVWPKWEELGNLVHVLGKKWKRMSMQRLVIICVFYQPWRAWCVCLWVDSREESAAGTYFQSAGWYCTLAQVSLDGLADQLCILRTWYWYIVDCCCLSWLDSVMGLLSLFILPSIIFFKNLLGLIFGIPRNHPARVDRPIHARSFLVAVFSL